MAALRLSVDDVMYLEYEEFDHKFLAIMKTELRDAVAHANK